MLPLGTELLGMGPLPGGCFCFKTNSIDKIQEETENAESIRSWR